MSATVDVRFRGRVGADQADANNDNQAPRTWINYAAFGTVVLLAAGTVAAVFAAAIAITMVATVAFGALAVTLGAILFASISAWTVSRNSTPVTEYYKTIGQHAGTAIAATYSAVAYIFMKVMIENAARGLGLLCMRKFGGADHVVEVRHTHG